MFAAEPKKGPTMPADEVRDLISAALLVVGSSTVALGALGLLRFPDVYTRSQAASKAATLGLATLFAAAAVYFADPVASVHAVAVILFAFMSVPVGAHVLAHAAHDARTPMWPPDAPDDLARDLADGSERQHDDANARSEL